MGIKVKVTENGRMVLPAAAELSSSSWATRK